MKNIPVILILICIGMLSFGGQGTSLFEGAERMQALDPSKGIEHYRLSNGKDVFFGPEIIIKVTSKRDVETLAHRYKPLELEYLSETLIMMTFSAGTETLRLSEKISAERSVLFAQPNLHMDKQLR